MEMKIEDNMNYVSSDDSSECWHIFKLCQKPSSRPNWFLYFVSFYSRTCSSWILFLASYLYYRFTLLVFEVGKCSMNLFIQTQLIQTYSYRAYIYKIEFGSVIVLIEVV